MLRNIPQKPYVNGALFLSVFVGGLATGIWAVKDTYENYYSDLSQKEISEAKLYYTQLTKKSEFSDPVVLATDKGYVVSPDPISTLTELTADYRQTSPSVTEEVEVPLTPYQAAIVRDAQPPDRNVFEAEPDKWDSRAELANRSSDRPYVITKEEFMQNEPEHEQVSLTYFEGDEVISDERDQPVENEDDLIGKDNLKFGHGSKDNNVVYIRSEGTETDFEVLRSHGKYAEEVLGFIEHSEDDGRPRRFRLHE
jgi:hypothetical protein